MALKKSPTRDDSDWYADFWGIFYIRNISLASFSRVNQEWWLVFIVIIHFAIAGYLVLVILQIIE